MQMFGWDDDTPLKAVLEYFEVDFETAVNPDVMSVIWNILIPTVADWSDDEHYNTGK